MTRKVSSLLVALNNHVDVTGWYSPSLSRWTPIFDTARRVNTLSSYQNQTRQTQGMGMGFGWVTFTWLVPVHVLPILAYPWRTLQDRGLVLPTLFLIFKWQKDLFIPWRSRISMSSLHLDSSNGTCRIPLSEYPHYLISNPTWSFPLPDMQISVDCGSIICLHPWWVKILMEEAVNDIKIAWAFDKPSSYFLNRPLIMLLEALGLQSSPTITTDTNVICFPFIVVKSYYKSCKTLLKITASTGIICFSFISCKILSKKL